ncbi:hypothetical protein M378DRAFT_496318 [Amanita muscaria Koide BX008]|uniref:Uncharacterized protein n=1 Tax=Amanita muscaria (strain Koide BX008) TaxID=946122 RepID=A0A0C2TU78_AMAMK|nr:hypothetical protein M378DRAFT_496318 [Amanita muscaria Koide BX008]
MVPICVEHIGIRQYGNTSFRYFAAFIVTGTDWTFFQCDREWQPPSTRCSSTRQI